MRGLIAAALRLVRDWRHQRYLRKTALVERRKKDEDYARTLAAALNGMDKDRGWL